MDATPGHPRLSNPAAERVRKVARLSGRSARRREGMFLAEGPQAVREAVPSGLVVDLYADEAALSRHPEILQEATARGVRVFVCDEPVMRALSDTVTPQGLVAVCRQETVSLTGLADRLASARDAGEPVLLSVLSHVRDPGNAGTVIRATDAAGGKAVVLSDASVDPFNPKCVRATAGSLFHLDTATGVPLAEAIDTLRGCGVGVLAADGAGDVDLDHLSDEAWAGRGPLAGPVAWIFGNEAWGLSEHEASLADHVVRVPVHGRAESLNLATAATVCVYAAARGQRIGRR